MLSVNCVVWYCEIIVRKKKKKRLLVIYWSNFVAAGRVIAGMFYWIWSARTWLNPMHTFQMNENSDCPPDVITQHQCLMLVSKLEWFPTAMFQHLLESLPRRVEADQPSIKPNDFTLNTQQAHRACCLGVCRLFVHIMYRGSSNPIAID